MIPQRNLSVIANRLLTEIRGEGHPNARRVPERTIELDYCLSWFLACFGEHPFGKELAFKGGTALRRCHIGEYRFSEDLDFTALRDGVTMEELRRAVNEVAAVVRQRSGIQMDFDHEDTDSHQNSHTFYVGYTGPLGRRDTFKVDVTLKEMVVLDLVTLPVIKTYPEFLDVPENAGVLCYCLTEIVAEKIVALSDRARTQPRDLYDLWYLTHFQDVDMLDAVDAVMQKLTFRGRPQDDILGAVARKESALRKLWGNRLASQMSVVPEFDEVFRAVCRKLRQAGFETHQSEKVSPSGRRKT
jgi:predicted nucleotidyltransferase component of viral defense system